MFIDEIRLQTNFSNEYPYTLPVVQALSKNSLKLNQPISFFAGENGSGKSTLLEAIAISFGMNPEGGTKNFNFSTYDSHSELHEFLTLVRKGLIPKVSFFLRAENYYNLASEVEELGLSTYYGKTALHKMSHGEGMLSIITHRFGPNGLYILDEPESGLSVSRQMTLLREILLLSKQNCQFLIATHSPVLLAASGATIFDGNNEMKKIDYQTTDAYKDMKLFLDNPERMTFYLEQE
ncbi:AAA family ATPase [Enterococcus alishanensis]